MKHLSATFLLLTVMVAGGTARAQVTYYVSENGDDGNDGLARDSALHTIQAAADMVQPGDTVIVTQGHYAGFFLDTKSGTEAAPIQFQAEGQVVVEGEGSRTCQRHETVCLWESNYVHVTGFEIVGRDCGYGQCDVLSVRADGGQQHASVGNVIRNNVLHGGESRGLYITFGVDAVIEGNEIYDTGIGIYFANGAPASYGDENSTIAGNHIHDNADLAIHMNADASSPGDGIIRGLTVVGNRIENNASQGIHFDGVCDSLVANNLVVGNNRGIIVSRVDGALSPENMVVVNNTVIQRSGTQVCLRIGGGSHDIVVFNNVFLHEDTMVVDLEDCGSPITSDYNAVSNLNQIQGATGGESHSLETDLAGAGFTAPGSGDYSLTQGSPLVDQGTASLGGQDAPATDIRGATRPADSGFDIGAYEFGSAGLVIVTSSLPDAVEGQSYDVSLEAAGGTSPYSWQVASGDLPGGLSLDGTSGRITGTPTVQGTFTFSVQVNDSGEPAQGADREFTLLVHPAGTLLDAGVDAAPDTDAVSHGDATTGGDAGSEGNGDSGGCGCSADTSEIPGSWIFLIMGLGWLLTRRKKHG